MKPLANFVCNDKRCRTKKNQAPVYELPINATHCPMGHRKVVRIFDRVNVRIGRAKPDFPDMRHTSSSKAARIDVIAEPAISQADANAARMREARLKFPNAHMVPTKHMKTAIGGLMQGMGVQGAIPIRMDPTDTDKARRGTELPGLVGELAELRQGQVPTTIERRDQEFKVVRNADGTVAMEKTAG